ncbi:MAG: hypothetical protein PWQ77_878 [Kosmotogales bacterium]|nr:hypothetical protein [Kosmotogales bacterium]
MKIDYDFGIRNKTKKQMLISAIIGIAIALLIFFFPGGAFIITDAALWVIKILIIGIILYFTLIKGIHLIKENNINQGVLFIVLGGILCLIVGLISLTFLIYLISIIALLLGLVYFILNMKKSGLDEKIILSIIIIVLSIIVIIFPQIFMIYLGIFILMWGLYNLYKYFQN